MRIFGIRSFVLFLVLGLFLPSICTAACYRCLVRDIIPSPPRGACRPSISTRYSATDISGDTGTCPPEELITACVPDANEKDCCANFVCPNDAVENCNTGCAPCACTGSTSCTGSPPTCQACIPDQKTGCAGGGPICCGSDSCSSGLCCPPSAPINSNGICCSASAQGCNGICVAPVGLNGACAFDCQCNTAAGLCCNYNGTTSNCVSCGPSGGATVSNIYGGQGGGVKLLVTGQATPVDSVQWCGVNGCPVSGSTGPWPKGNPITAPGTPPIPPIQPSQCAP
jgi:hypothetical protein